MTHAPLDSAPSDTSDFSSAASSAFASAFASVFEVFRRRRRVIGGLVVLVLATLAVWWSLPRPVGRLYLTAREPVVVEFFVHGDATRCLLRATAPAADPLTLPAGEYDLRILGRGTIGDVLVVDVGPGVRQVDVSLDHGTYAAPLATSRFLAPIGDPEVTALLAFTARGLELFDGPRRSPTRDFAVESSSDESSPIEGFRSRWTLDLTAPETKGLPDGFAWSDAWEWLADARFDREVELYQPRLASEPVDLNGDEIRDVVLSGRNQAWVLAVSGADGRVLWSLARGASERHWKATSVVVDRPRVVADRDGDGAAELLVTIVDRASGGAGKDGPERSVELLSGRTGRAIWRFEPPAAWFGDASEADDDVPEPWQSRQLAGLSTHVETNLGRDSFPLAARPAPWGTETAVLLVAGRTVVVLDPGTGLKLCDDYDLGGHPWTAAEPGDCDGDGYPDVVCRTPAVKPLGVHSPRLARVVWAAAPGAPDAESSDALPPPSATIVADLDGDGRDDVVSVLAGKARNERAEDENVVSVRDGATGAERWRRVLRAHWLDALASTLKVGPDVDGDGVRELFAATLAESTRRVRVDALSGADGSDVWRSDAPPLPIVDERDGGPFEGRVGMLVGATWRRGGLDGWPQCVVVERHEDAIAGKFKTSVASGFSAGTGRVEQAGFDVDRALAIDLDGDGVDELLTFREGAESAEGTWRFTVGTAAAPWRRAGGGSWGPLARLNDDDVLDVVLQRREEMLAARIDTTPRGGLAGIDVGQRRDEMLAALDGRTGERIWVRSYESEDDLAGVGVDAKDSAYSLRSTELTHPLLRLDAASHVSRGADAATHRARRQADVDGDGAADLVRIRQRGERSVGFLISGRTGAPRRLFTFDDGLQHRVLGQIDLDGRGPPEWVLEESVEHVSRTLCAWSSDLRRPLWRIPVVGGGREFGWFDCDCDGDGILDVVGARHDPGSTRPTWFAASGRTGRELWSTAGTEPAKWSGSYDLQFLESSATETLALFRASFRDPAERSAIAEICTLELLDVRTGERRWARNERWGRGCSAIRHFDGTLSLLRPPLATAADEVLVVDAAGVSRHKLAGVAPDAEDRRLVRHFADTDGDGRRELCVLTDAQTLTYREADRKADELWRPATTGRVARGLTIFSFDDDRESMSPTWIAQEPGFVSGLSMDQGRVAWHVPLPAAPVESERWLFSSPAAYSSQGRLSNVLSVQLSPATAEHAPYFLLERVPGWIGVRQAARHAATARRASHGDSRVLDDGWRAWGVDRAPTPPRPGLDPRLARPLPWTERRLAADPHSAPSPGRLSPWPFVRPLVRRSLVALTLIVGPVAFVGFALRRRRFSLRMLLILPVLVGAAMTVGGWNGSMLVRDEWFDELPRTTCLVEEATGFVHVRSISWRLAVRYAPPIGWTALAGVWLFTGRRRRTAWAVAALLAGAASLGAGQVAYEALDDPLAPDEYYAFDAGTWLLLDAWIVTSWLATIVWFPVRGVAAVLRRLRARRSPAAVAT